MNKYIKRRLMALALSIIGIFFSIYIAKIFLSFQSKRTTMYLPTKTVVHDLIKISVQPRLDQFRNYLYFQVSMESQQNPEFANLVVLDSVAIELDETLYLPSEWSEVTNTPTLKQGVLKFKGFEDNFHRIIFNLYLYEDLQLEWTFTQ